MPVGPTQGPRGARSPSDSADRFEGGQTAMGGTVLDPSGLEILHEDNHVLAVYKPAGVLVQTDRTGDASLQDTVRAWLKRRDDKPGNVFLGIVHRLDRPVAGVVLFAKTSKAAARLSARFRARDVRKTYRGVVLGVPAPAEGQLRDALVRDEARRLTRVVAEGTPGARAAALGYRTLDSRDGCALLEISPRTGRAHQIRVQLAHAGWPLLGDTKYGAPAPLPSRAIALYAAGIEVAHPVREEPVSVAVDPPEGWPWPPPPTARTRRRGAAGSPPDRRAGGRRRPPRDRHGRG